MRKELPTALITGINGQDGAYLARWLLSKGYRVFGTSRDASASLPVNLRRLGIASEVGLLSMSGNDFRSVLRTVKQVSPDEIYNLAGQTSVGLSFEQPVEALESITIGTVNLLEAIRFEQRDIRLYSAGSSECFGDTGGLPANESTPFHPRSPYAVAKTCAHHLVANYREAYGIFACTGILFNHESELRPERFVTQKIVKAAARIAQGSTEKLKLGNLRIWRDWGLASEYVELMWRMLQHHTAMDFVIATGRTESLEYFAQRAFAHFQLDWREHVESDPSLLRPADIERGAADASLAQREFGWRPRADVDEVVRVMCEAAARERRDWTSGVVVHGH
jgi:GDPmannose 4,6-dehydratase